MQTRVNISKTEPQAYKALYALEGYLAGTSLTRSQKDLIKIRASQINRCAYCIDMHTKEALNSGETGQRIFLLNAWRETNLFTDQEHVLLAMTEEITEIAKQGLSDATYAKAAALFSEQEMVHIIMAIVTINAWNRIAVSTNMGAEITKD
ncbi:MAG TPA: carboxymuconolactone decarboxylase family protein [Flavisolibacter sp.]|nr:carboxymuconolactone decarboxylase family protein [Flavisolibacter sp.]